MTNKLPHNTPGNDSCPNSPAWPQFSQEAIDSVGKVLASGHINYWTGTECKTFESEFAEYCNTAHALAVANGTVALEIALRAFDVGEGDEVIVPSRTFIATAGAVVAVGATPIIADIDPDTNNMTALTCARVLTPRTRAIIPVHLGGYPADVDAIVSLAHQVGAVVIEDCAQAHGATYKGRPVGSLGDAGCYSFCQDKIMPLGEGGMIVLSDEAAYQRAWSYREHGRDYELARNAGVGAASPDFKWLNTSFGTNGRLGEMEGALGRVLLRELPAMHAQRTLITGTVVAGAAQALAIKFLVPSSEERAAGITHAYYRLYGRIDESALAEGWSRNRIIEELNAAGVAVQYGSCALIGNEKSFARFPQDATLTPKTTLPGASTAHAESIAFYIHPTLTLEDAQSIAEKICEVMNRATA